MDESSQPKSGWRLLRRILIALAVLATLVAAFYTEEDWRGKHDWEKCKAQLESQGVVLDWDKFIPPPVPEGQNFYTAGTNFVKFRRISPNDPDFSVESNTIRSSWLRLEITSSNFFPILNTYISPPPVIAQIIVSSRINMEPKTNLLVVTLNDAAAPGKVEDLLRATIGQTIYGVQGFELSQFQLTNLAPAQIFVQADTPPSVEDLKRLIPSGSMISSSGDSQSGRLQIRATANPHIFRIVLTNVRITAAADYLKWSGQNLTAFDDVREALKRPYAILPGDYTKPYEIPIPNFVLLRALAQTLGQRAQCYFLLGEPDKALRELTLVHDVCRILEKPPTGQPETLVEAMINVAIIGLYVNVVAEGLQRHEWQEPQLTALQKQLEEINLPPILLRSFASELAASTHTLETLPALKLRDLFPNLKESLLPFFRAALAPRGWIYQNMVTNAKLMCRRMAGFDSTDGIIRPEKFVDADRELKKIPMRYKLFAVILIPNLNKASQTTAYNQTQVNEGQIACALERYHLAHSEYPDSLDALVPQFIETIPHDIMGGQPLHYRRTDDGKFLLYSIGWSEQDDGGRVAPHNEYGSVDFARGDWVWPN